MEKSPHSSERSLLNKAKIGGVASLIGATIVAGYGLIQVIGNASHQISNDVGALTKPFQSLGHLPVINTPPSITSQVITDSIQTKVEDIQVGGQIKGYLAVTGSDSHFGGGAVYAKDLPFTVSVGSQNGVNYTEKVLYSNTTTTYSNGKVINKSKALSVDVTLNQPSLLDPSIDYISPAFYAPIYPPMTNAQIQTAVNKYDTEVNQAKSNNGKGMPEINTGLRLIQPWYFGGAVGIVTKADMQLQDLAQATAQIAIEFENFSGSNAQDNRLIKSTDKQVLENVQGQHPGATIVPHYSNTPTQTQQVIQEYLSMAGLAGIPAEDYFNYDNKTKQVGFVMQLANGAKVTVNVPSLTSLKQVSEVNQKLNLKQP